MSGSTGSQATIGSGDEDENYQPGKTYNQAQQIDLSSLVAGINSLVQTISKNNQNIINAIEGLIDV